MNANAKHTPGPWTAHRMLITPKAKDRRCGFVVNGPDDKPDDLPTRICDLRVPAGMDGFREGESNARLIATAPALLSALHACLGDLADIVRAEGGDESPAMIQARAAIAQAEGGAQ
jgi:hypothetical protein